VLANKLFVKPVQFVLGLFSATAAGAYTATKTDDIGDDLKRLVTS